MIEIVEKFLGQTVSLFVTKLIPRCGGVVFVTNNETR